MLWPLVSIILLAAIAGCGDSGGGDTPPAADEPDGPSQPDPPEDFPDIELNAFASGFAQPVQVVHAGDGSGRLFVVERGGTVRIVADGETASGEFLDIGNRITTGHGEQGLLGIAFPPDYAEKGHFYANYTDTGGDTVVSRFPLSDDPDRADEAGEQMLLQVEQPAGNHNGGQIAFGPDGYLYIGLGDGGGGGDPDQNGQNRDTLLGTILRIDVENGSEDYAVPESNPFGTDVWAYGLRNPWRFSFDRDTGDLYIADVGQQFIEEINVQPADSGGGENYGWNIMEGSQCFSSASCDQSGLTLPVAEYDHQDGDCSITGGYVYRGAQYPDLNGIYLYGDFCSGKLWGLRRGDDGWESELLRETGFSISTFGEDRQGEVYVADYASGTVYRVQQSGG
jgi:glucose/arabinose dehydrogenase